MTQPVVVQTSSRVRTTGATNATVFSTDITSGNTIIVICMNNSRGASVVPTDTLGNTYVLDHSYQETAYTGWRVAVYRTTSTTGGANTVSLTNNGASEISVVCHELSSVTGSPLDKTSNLTAVTWGTANVTSTSTGTLTQADEIVYAIAMGRSSVAFTTLPAPSGYTDMGTAYLGGGTSTTSPCHAGYVITSATTAQAPVWAPTGGGSNSTPYAAIVVVTYKGGAPSPSITGGTANPVHLSTGNTITGTSFGASQGAGTLVIGGQSQTVTAWADTSITYTANRGANLDDVAVNAVVTDNAGAPSSNYALTGFQEPAGYYYVTLTSVNSTADYRITAVADLAIGNQLEWDNALVTINPDGTYVADPSVTSFNVRVGVTTDGWGSLALQTVGSANDSDAAMNGRAMGLGLKLGRVIYA